MKVNVLVPLTDPFGKPFPDNATVQTAIYASLANVAPGDDQMTVEEKMRHYRLLQLVVGVQQKDQEEGKPKTLVIDLDSEQVQMIKDRAVRVLSVVAFGALVDMLENRQASEVALRAV